MARILLIDDDEGFRSMLQRTLQRAGYEVVASGSGKEGLDLLSRVRVDLVLTDIIMPDMDGLEIIQRLRQTQPSLKIIAISGGGRKKPDSYLKCAQLFGALAVLTKPLDNQQLFASIEAALCSDGAGEG